MNCQELRTLLHPYIDGELDLVRHVEIEEHLKGLPPMRPSRNNRCVRCGPLWLVRLAPLPGPGGVKCAACWPFSGRFGRSAADSGATNLECAVCH